MKIINYLFTITLLLVITGCYKAERNCTDFKTGYFKSQFEIDGKIHESQFMRNDSLEISTYNNKIDTATVRWINNCEYIVQKINPKNRLEKQAVHMKILTTTTNGYSFEFCLVGSTQKKRGFVTKIK